MNYTLISKILKLQKKFPDMVSIHFEIEFTKKILKAYSEEQLNDTYNKMIHLSLWFDKGFFN